MLDKAQSRYNGTALKKAIQNPHLFIDEFCRLYHQRIQKYMFKLKYGRGIDIMSKDWDNLIILDACRYDIFKQTNFIEGELRPVVSQGSHSKEFCNGNFYGKKLHDTVYVTANPFGADISHEIFYKMTTTFAGELIKYSEHSQIVLTDEERKFHPSHPKNVSPEIVSDMAIREYNNNPNKRIIIHYMQPHDPYLGTTAKELRDSLEPELSFYRQENLDEVDTDDNKTLQSLLGAAAEGYISQSELLEVYKENLQIVLKHVKSVLTKIEGKTIITADHGEFLGDKCAICGKQYDHPENRYTEPLRVVPWLVIDDGERRDIVSEEPVEADRTSEEEINKQLEALGYLN